MTPSADEDNTDGSGGGGGVSPLGLPNNAIGGGEVVVVEGEEQENPQ